MTTNPAVVLRPRPVLDSTLVQGLRNLLAAAASPRFRSQTRIGTRAAARHLLWIVGVGTVADVVWLLPTHLGDLPRMAVFGGCSLALAVVAYRVLARSRHANPEPLIFGTLVTIDLFAAMTAGQDPSSAHMIADYLLLMPPVIALLVPWGTRIHLGWLFGHAVIVALMVMLATDAVDTQGARMETILVLFVSTGVSLVGHLSNLRGRVTSFALIEQVRSMNRAARRSDIRLRRLNRLLEVTVRTDDLTGLGNRIALQGHLDQVRSRIERHGDRYAVVMVDLDHFKAINDHLGHLAGDTILRRVAAAVAGSIRASDATFRLGGEEFAAVVALPGSDRVEVVAERIRGAVEALGIDHPANAPFAHVTISVGACVVDRAALGESDEAWFDAADAALYAAKRQGRNRSVIGDRPT